MDASQVSPRCAQMPPGDRQMPPICPHMSPRCPQMSPRAPQAPNLQGFVRLFGCLSERGLSSLTLAVSWLQSTPPHKMSQRAPTAPNLQGFVRLFGCLSERGLSSLTLAASWLPKHLPTQNEPASSNSSKLAWCRKAFRQLVRKEASGGPWLEMLQVLIKFLLIGNYYVVSAVVRTPCKCGVLTT